MDRHEFEKLSKRHKITIIQQQPIIAIREDVPASLHLFNDFYVEIVSNTVTYAIETITTLAHTRFRVLTWMTSGYLYYHSANTLALMFAFIS